MRAIEMVTFPGVQLLDVAGPLQVFASANDIVAALAKNSRKQPAYQLGIVTRGGQGVTASAGFGFRATPLPRPGAAVDTLIVPGGPGVEAATADAKLLDWICRRSRAARRTVSVCTGAFLLAAAGVLDGRRAATHWQFCAELARRFPAVRVEADPIFVRDGPIWTSAGVTSGIDLSLALVEEDLGRTLALAVARYLVVFLKRPGGQAQFSTALSLQTADDHFGTLHAWIAQHLADDLSLRVLARQARMSERSFSRHYVEEVGMTPGRAVENLRVESARQFLSETRLSVKQIAHRCGFGSEETLRRSFLRILATTPSDYRARFGQPRVQLR